MKTADNIKQSTYWVIYLFIILPIIIALHFLLS